MSSIQNTRPEYMPLQPPCEVIASFGEDEIHYQIYYYNGIKGQLKYVVKCDLCNEFVHIRSVRDTSVITRHRGCPTCLRKQQKEARVEVEREIRAAKSMLADLGMKHMHDSSTERDSDSLNTTIALVSERSTIHRQESQETLFCDTTTSSNLNSSSILMLFNYNAEPELLPPSSPPNDILSSSPGTYPKEILEPDEVKDLKEEYPDLLPIEAIPHAHVHGVFCQGQGIRWNPGSIFSNYAFFQHEVRQLTWNPIGCVGNDCLIIQSTSCNNALTNSKEKSSGTCDQCAKLVHSHYLRQSMIRAAKKAKRNTPYCYLTLKQLSDGLRGLQDEVQDIKADKIKLERKLMFLETRISDWKQLMVFISNNDIPRATTVLKQCHIKGAPPNEINNRLHDVLDHVYTPKLGEISRQKLATAFLIKALGGHRLLYALQQADGYPSDQSLRRRWHVPELLVSLDLPTEEEIQANIKNILGRRKESSEKRIGVTLMIDGLALEEVCRYDRKRNAIVGLCHQHSGGISKVVNDNQSIENIQMALEKKECHISQEGLVFAIAPITGEESYYPSPIVLAGSCKVSVKNTVTTTTGTVLESVPTSSDRPGQSESARRTIEMVCKCISVYKAHPDGEAQFGPIISIATDGESLLRTTRYTITLNSPLNQNSPEFRTLSQLGGMNLQTGIDGIINSCDPKHIGKRMAGVFWSTRESQVGDVKISLVLVTKTMKNLLHMSAEETRKLLTPADRQNVPIAEKLVQIISTIYTSEEIQDRAQDPSTLKQIKQIGLLGYIFGLFIQAFRDRHLSLSEQVCLLSKFMHLTFAFYRKYQAKFMNTQLYAGSMSTIKCIIFQVVRLQQINPEVNFYIFLVGTDRLEGLFSQVRTQDHSRNFDAYQLAQKLSVGAECSAIFDEFPNLYQGHRRRSTTGQENGNDHLNPKSWVGNVRVGSVNVLEQYAKGRAEADTIIEKEMGLEGKIDWDDVFRTKDGLEVDFLRPFGTYIGSRGADSNLNVPHDITPSENTKTENSTKDQNEVNVYDEEYMELNPTEEIQWSEFVTKDGQKFYKSSLASTLQSDKARKVAIRPLRAYGQTLELLIQKQFKNLDTAPDPSNSNLEDSRVPDIESNMIGTTLVQCNNGKIALAIVQIEYFLKEGSNQKLYSLKPSQLEDPKISMICQVLDLEWHEADNGSTGWIWTTNFVEITEGSKLQQRTIISGPSFQLHHRKPSTLHLLDPKTCFVHNDTQNPTLTQWTWIFDHSPLLVIMDKEYKRLLMGSLQQNISNFQCLPFIKSTLSFPYCFNGTTYFTKYREINPEPGQIPAQTLTEGKAQCLLCGKLLKLGLMRNHVGHHLIKHIRDVRDGNELENYESSSLQGRIPLNPCGWCGASNSCKTTLQWNNSKPIIQSDCCYYYSKMVYAGALISTPATPCTNIPIICLLCQVHTPEEPCTIWKYNLDYHMSTVHPNEKNIPLSMMVTAHISYDEEQRLSVPTQNTMERRERMGVLNSDDLDLTTIEKRNRSTSMAEVEGQAYKKTRVVN